MTTEQIQALRSIGKSIVDACKAAGPVGAPGGIIYAALMGQGCSLRQYQSIMAGMMKAGMVTQSGDCFHVTDKGLSFVGGSK